MHWPLFFYAYKKTFQKNLPATFENSVLTTRKKDFLIIKKKWFWLTSFTAQNHPYTHIGQTDESPPSIQDFGQMLDVGFHKPDYEYNNQW